MARSGVGNAMPRVRRGTQRCAGSARYRVNQVNNRIGRMVVCSVWVGTRKRIQLFCSKGSVGKQCRTNRQRGARVQREAAVKR